MFEAARFTAILAAVLLVVAIAVWVKLMRGPELQRLDRRSGGSVHNVEGASQLLVMAVGVSAVASILSLLGLFAT